MDTRLKGGGRVQPRQPEEKVPLRKASSHSRPSFESELILTDGQGQKVEHSFSKAGPILFNLLRQILNLLMIMKYLVRRVGRDLGGLEGSDPE